MDLRRADTDLGSQSELEPIAVGMAIFYHSQRDTPPPEPTLKELVVEAGKNIINESRMLMPLESAGASVVVMPEFLGGAQAAMETASQAKLDLENALGRQTGSAGYLEPRCVSNPRRRISAQPGQMTAKGCGLCLSKRGLLKHRASHSELNL